MSVEWSEESRREAPPYAYVATIAGVRVSVHRHIDYPAGTWLLTAEPWFRLRGLTSKEHGDAKREALLLLRRSVDQLHTALAAALEAR